MTGLIHLYTGDGKGKTTAAVGLAVRFCGAGGKAVVAQFLKGRATAEVAPLRALGIEVLRDESSTRFVFEMDEAEKNAYRRTQRALLDEAKRRAGAGAGLVVLDEVCGALATGMLAEEDVLAFLRERPAACELVLTGRDAPASLIDAADYVTELRAKKHPYNAGVPARRGIEY